MKKFCLLLLLSVIAFALSAASEKVEKLLVAAQKGDPKAQWELGYCYATGGDGVAKDYKQSVRWYRKSAVQGYADGQWKMGVCYYVGYGVRRDYKQAVYWHRKAAEQGHSFSQYSLGKCYEKGTGVKKDIKQAVYWYRKAATRYEKAREALKKLGFADVASPTLLDAKCSKIKSSPKKSKQEYRQNSLQLRREIESGFKVPVYANMKDHYVLMERDTAVAKKLKYMDPSIYDKNYPNDKYEGCVDFIEYKKRLVARKKIKNPVYWVEKGGFGRLEPKGLIEKDVAVKNGYDFISVEKYDSIWPPVVIW